MEKDANLRKKDNIINKICLARKKSKYTLKVI